MAVKKNGKGAPPEPPAVKVTDFEQILLDMGVQRGSFTDYDFDAFKRTGKVKKKEKKRLSDLV